MIRKASAILIKTDSKVTDGDLLSPFGYSKAYPDKITDTLNSVINPEEFKIYIGRVNDIILICERYFPDQFFSGELSPTENALINLFPQSEILAFSLYSTNNHYGYAFIKNGEKIRVKTGYEAQPVIFEQGDPLPEEASIYAFAKEDENGDKYFYNTRSPEYPDSEDSVGQELVSNISARFLGEPLNQSKYLVENFMQGYFLRVDDRGSNNKQKGRSFFDRIKSLVVRK